MINFIKYKLGTDQLQLIYFSMENILNKVLDTNKDSVFNFKSDEIYSKRLSSNLLIC